MKRFWNLPAGPVLAAAFAIAVMALALVAPQHASHAQQVNGLACSQVAQYDASTNGSTRIFTANAASRSQVYICGYIINVGATATNVQLKYGTGTNCGTGTQNITPNFVLPIAGKVDDHSPVFRGLMVPPANDFCLVTSAGNPVQAMIFYSYQ